MGTVAAWTRVPPSPINGTEAKTRVLIVHTDGERNWGTVGVSDSIIEASWIALTDGIDLFLQRRRTGGNTA